MKPDALYIFAQRPLARSRYKLIEHHGADIPGFPAVMKRDHRKSGGKAGEQYLGFRETANQKPGHRQFTHTLELENSSTFTGVNFTPEHPRRAFGDYGPDAVLVEFSETRERLTVYFFQGMKEAEERLFQAWTAGELVLTPEADALPLETKKAG